MNIRPAVPATINAMVHQPRTPARARPASSRMLPSRENISVPSQRKSSEESLKPANTLAAVSTGRCCAADRFHQSLSSMPAMLVKPRAVRIAPTVVSREPRGPRSSEAAASTPSPMNRLP
jgi:hypothetical protein